MQNGNLVPVVYKFYLAEWCYMLDVQWHEACEECMVILTLGGDSD